jgi:hypothetical protein
VHLKLPGPGFRFKRKPSPLARIPPFGGVRISATVFCGLLTEKNGINPAIFGH